MSKPMKPSSAPIPRPTRPPFLKAERGALSVEAAIIMPVLMILYVAGFSYFDGYRREAAAQRATFTLGDLLSRKTDSAITPRQLDGLEALYERLTFSEDRAWLRVTELQRKDDAVEVVWSVASDGNPSLTDARLMAHLDRVPTLADNERVVAVETFTYYDSFANVGVADRIFDNFVATRQRYWPQLALDSSALPDGYDLRSGVCPPAPDLESRFSRKGFAITENGQVSCGHPPAGDQPEDSG